MTSSALVERGFEPGVGRDELEPGDELGAEEGEPTREPARGSRAR